MLVYLLNKTKSNQAIASPFFRKVMMEEFSGYT